MCSTRIRKRDREESKGISKEEREQLDEGGMRGREAGREGGRH